MAKIKIGSPQDQSVTRLDVALMVDSEMELDVGGSRDMSRLEVSIVERVESEVSREVSQLRNAVAQIRKNNPSSHALENLQREADQIADTAQRIVQERKWYSVSSKGLGEAVQAIGSVASPVFAIAQKLILLLKQAHG